MTWKPKRAEPVEPFKRIGVEKAREMIERGGVQIIDVREPDEYAKGHIVNSVLIPLGSMVNFSRVKELSETEELLFVCEVGERSAVACEVAAAAGRKKLYNMEGGMQAWRALRYPIEL